jgi:hypothetical protein
MVGSQKRLSGPTRAGLLGALASKLPAISKQIAKLVGEAVAFSTVQDLLDWMDEGIGNFSIALQLPEVREILDEHPSSFPFVEEPDVELADPDLEAKRLVYQYRLRRHNEAEKTHG